MRAARMDLLFFVIFGLFLFYVVPLLFYLAPGGLIYFGVSRLRRGKHALGVVALGLAAAPFIYYGVLYAEAASRPAKRAAEVASWPRKAVDPAALPGSLSIVPERSGSSDRHVALIAAGFFDQVEELGRFYGAERSGGCLKALVETSLIESPRGAAMARKAFRICPVEQPAPDPPVAPEVRVLRNSKSTLRMADRKDWLNDSTMTYRAWEMRWSDRLGGELIAYHEIGHFSKPVFPPVFRFQPFQFKRFTILGDRKHWYLFEFVAESLGLSLPEDVAFDASPAELSATMAGLVSHLNAGTIDYREGSYAVLLLLGQWGDNPALRAEFARLSPERARFLLSKAFQYLLNTNYEADRKILYPKLHEYRDDLVMLCAKRRKSGKCDDKQAALKERFLRGDFD